MKTALLRVGSECYRNKDTAVSCCVAFHFSIETFTFGNKPKESPVALRTGGETDTFYCQHTHTNPPLISPFPHHCHLCERDKRCNTRGNGGIDEEGEQRAGRRWESRVRDKNVNQESWGVRKVRNEGRLAERVFPAS